MKYSKIDGFKYRVLKTFSYQTEIFVEKPIISYFSSLSENGLLTIEKGFCWDGATGALDTENIMRASCIHDAFCNWFSQQLISKDQRKQADQIFRKIMIEDKVPEFRAGYLFGIVEAYVNLRY